MNQFFRLITGNNGMVITGNYDVITEVIIRNKGVIIGNNKAIITVIICSNDE